MDKPMQFAIEFDDFSPRNSNLSYLEELREHYPDFKVTLFTVPWEIRFGSQAPITLVDFEPWCRAVKNAEDWLEIALHGLTHGPLEFGEISYEGAKKRITVAEKMFENRGLKLAKIFKAPQWALSKEGKQAALDLGYKVVEDHYYPWNLKDDLTDEVKKLATEKIVVGHGHVQNTMGNGTEEVMPRLMKLPPDTKFYKLSEALK